MQGLEKILEEIDEMIDGYRKNPDLITENITDFCYGLIRAKDIIRRHMNDGWTPVEKELPPNAKHMGALCPRYQLSTKYGVTEGWYNPDLESWLVLCWFLTKRYEEEDINFEKGSYPKIVRCENKVNDKYSIVLAWRPISEPYRPEDCCGEYKQDWKAGFMKRFERKI